MVHAGKRLNIHLQYYGRPLSTVTWYKANCDVEERAEITTTEWSTELTIETTERNDCGKYIFTLESAAGIRELNLSAPCPGRHQQSTGVPLSNHTLFKIGKSRDAHG